MAAIPGADGAGLTLVENGRADTLVAERRLVRSGFLSGDGAWPHFGPRVGRLGVHSALSLPLLLSENEVVGALNVYAREKDAFDDRAAKLGQMFSVPAAVSVRNAQMLEHTQRLVGQLNTALTSRAGPSSTRPWAS